MSEAVVVPAIGTGSSLACVRSLGRRGIPVVAAAASESAPAAASKYCRETAVVPDPSTGLGAYRDALLALADRDDVLTVVPLREPDAYVLAQNRDRFAERVAAPWPAFETFERVRDRRRLFDVAETAGVPAPETEVLDGWDVRARDAVVKSRYTVLVEDDATAYPDVTVVPAGTDPDPDALEERMGHRPLVQEYVPGTDEYGFFALCDRGDPVTTFQHRRVRSYSYTGGASVFRKAVDEPDLREHGTALLSALDWHGPAMVEFRRDPRDGRFKLLEVNPRFWGSLQLAVHAGVDFPHEYYRLAAGDGASAGREEPARETGDGPSDVAAESTYETGVGSHVLRGELAYLASLLREGHDPAERPSLPAETARILASLWREPNFDYCSRDDPKPFVRDAAGVVDEYAPSLSGVAAAGRAVPTVARRLWRR
ncbi:ATP-grasp domain-containing protein [Halomicrococcus sp. NG-SE-24]|uniref:carboxylate--amine ligase n=1 Tax=Halomicrococcus sp. NG-SE-24 TaxID=3436928 RepID=UPI003D96E67F